MTTKLYNWLETMRELNGDVGPAVRIQATRNSRDVGWIFELTPQSKLDELVEQIDSACRNCGFPGPYELRAYDAENRFCGPFQYKAQVAEIVPASAAPAMMEHAFGQAMDNQVAFSTLALKGIAQAQRYQEKHIAQLERENDKLRRENDQLRTKLVDHWESVEKLNTHEVETRAEIERVKRMGNLAETAVTALMGRLTSKGSNASQVIDMKLAQRLFQSLAGDMERMQKMLALMSDDERMAVMELSRRATEEEHSSGSAPLEKPNGVAAAQAAALTNGGN